MRTLYTNGSVVTMDPIQPQAAALVTEGNKIIGVGDVPTMTELAGEAAVVVDMKGGALFPGFIETHNHISMYALYRSYAYLGQCETINEVIAAMKAHADSRPQDPVVVGYSYDDTLTTDGRSLDRHDLDKVSTDRPVFIIHISAHLGFLNTPGLAHFNIDAQTPAPEGGAIHHDAQGEPTGRLDEMAFFAIPAQLGKPDVETYTELLKASVAEYNRMGITAIHDAGLGLEGMSHTVMESYHRLLKSRDLNLRVFMSALVPEFEELSPAPFSGTMGEERFVMAGVKLFIDGSIQGETAALLEPYTSKPDWQGELFTSREEFEALVLKYHNAGHHITIHSNGDAAIETSITAVEKAQAACPRSNTRYMLIHAQMAHTDHLQRMRRLGMIPSFFGYHVYNWGDRHRDIFIGPDRAARMNPAGEAEAMGLPFTLHVDTPVLPIQVIDSIHTAVNRTTRDGKILGPDQRTTAHAAVAAYTSTAAICSFSENERGSLTPGKLADLTLVSQDMTTVPPETIRDTQIWMTVLDGETVFKSSDL